jgi:nucleoid DNA-binding protein
LKEEVDVASNGKPITKSDFIKALGERTGLSKKEVTGFMDALTDVIKSNLGKKGAGVITLPGLVKLKVVRKPATKAKPGVNPFTGEKIMIKAKPARNAVKALPVKALKDSVA